MISTDSFHLQAWETDETGLIPEDIVMPETTQHEDEESLFGFIGHLIDSEKGHHDEEQKHEKGRNKGKVQLFH